MAEKSKRPRLDVADNNFDFLSDDKVAQCLTKYPSTVFACETSVDTRYIKCDFPCCSKHSGNQEVKPSWILNTLRNVKILERHVGKEVAQFMKENLPESFDQNFHMKNSLEIIKCQSLRQQPKKVLLVFNLADPQSLLGEWIALFLKAAELKCGREDCDMQVITQSFTSRYELMSCITKLEFIKRHPCVDVIAILSCHSSSQGQVFSCTPSVMSRCFNYEEFCSLHDFVQVLQDSLGHSLSAIHISSCFALKLDCSHQDWPVDVEWLENKLHCTLTGSTKEVYETGSQVADLYVSLSTLIGSVDNTDSLGDTLKNTIYSARVYAFPDLAQEMGLEVLSTQDVGRKVSSPCIDEGVSAPGQVNSCLHVVILIGYDFNDEQSQETHEALANALVANLKMRQMSDIKCKYTLLPCHDSKTSWKERLHSCIHSVSNTEEKLFFVALGSCWTHLNLLDIMQKELYSSKRPDSCYGIHFQEITSMQAYFLKSKLNIINSCANDVMPTSSRKFHIVATGLVQDEKKSSPINTFPTLLYMIHLAIGENGERVSGEGHIPAHLKYKQYKGPGISQWTLEDVYMETSYVLSGLSRKAGLCLLSLPKTNVSHTKSEQCSDKTTSDPTTLDRCCEASTSSRELLPGVEKCTFSSLHSTTINDRNCSTVGECGTEKFLPPLSQNLSNVEKCAGFFNSLVNDTNSLTAGESSKEVTLSHKIENSFNVANGAVSSNSLVNDSCGSTSGESSVEVTLPHKTENSSNVEKNTVYSNNLVIDGSRSTVSESSAEVALPPRAVDASNVEKGTVSSDSSVMDCIGSKAGESNMKVALPHKAGENLSNIEKHTVSSLNSTVNDCSISTVGHCDTRTVSKDKIHESDDEDEYICVTDDETDRPCSGSKWDTSDDLPLMANVDEVLVTHYVLNLGVNFSDKVMSGDITLFLKPATELVIQRQFQLCLDCSLVDIESVEEIDLKDEFSVKQYSDDHTRCAPYSPDVFQVDKKVPVALPYSLLPYAVRNWCVRIWKPYHLGKTWPRCVRIKYCTRPEGKSLTWTTDQDNRSCVFSPGAYINNRSLMPCQEPPIAMSTWQAAIHVPKGCTVLMSGNQLPVQNSDDADTETFLYEMNIPLPCSTLALAIGWFECRQTSTVALFSTIPCRVFSATSVINEASEELLPRCSKYVTAACEMLGPYPFSRMDLVILPRCFACMGLMSPNMAFLSQSILARDGSMCTRVAHEISHSWFGLLIGAKDWSEEWLSEGFATYMEERILCKVEGWEGDEELFYVELYQILKHRTLLAEFQHADENMQRLRPKLPSVVTAAEAVRQSMEKKTTTENKNDDVPHTTVTNGQVCSKKWTQIYYLKGYFLLHYMASLVGVTNFDNFLKDYVLEYGGKLVNSEEFFEYFEKRFTSLREENIKDRLMHEWLERHGLPVHVPKKIGRPDNHLINEVEMEFAFWKKTDAVNKRKKTQQIRTKKPIKDHPTVNDQVQLVVLLERLLERDAIATATLTQLDNCYHFAQKNAEVRHRWCELVVKHRYNPGYPQVKRFLIEDQGMGIYLFGELLISQQPKQKQLVLDVLSTIGGEMDQCTLKTVQDMLEGRD